MAADTELVLVFGGMHLVALLAGCALFYMFLRSDTVDPYEPPDDEDDGGGGGGNDRLRKPPKPPRPGGIPLPDAEQSSQRLRGPGRIGEGRRLTRRPAHPAQPHRVPQRTQR